MGGLSPEPDILKKWPSAARRNQYSDAAYADEICAEIKLNHFVSNLIGQQMLAYKHITKQIALA